MPPRPQSPASGVQQLFDTACRFHADGALQRAEHLYREVLRQAPQHADALNMLGVVGCQSGNPQAGVGLIRAALALNAEHPDYNNNLGMALLDMGQRTDAIAAFEKAVKTKPGFPEAHFNLANALRVDGDFAAAEKHYRRALKSRPDYPDVLNNLANLLRQRGAVGEAGQLLHKLVRLRPDDRQGRYNLALALQAQGKFDAAVAEFQHVLKRAPVDAATWEALGDTYRQSGALSDAAAAFAQAVSVGAPTARLLNRLGLAQLALNQLSSASASFEQARQLAPNDPDTLNNLGMVASASGDADAARGHFELAATAQPAHGDAYRNLAQLELDQAERDGLADRIATALAGEVSAEARVEMNFALGRLRDRDGDYAAAFMAFTAANAGRQAQTRFDAAAQDRYIDALAGTFTGEYMRAFPQLGSDSALPVFIVGMPRSGTSLVEQIIASHGTVHGAGELTFFPQHMPVLARRFGSNKAFPQCLPGHEADLAPLAEDYLRLLSERGGEARRVSDKMPYNFLYLGVIALLFPGARVIHCRRQAMATCFSIFCHDLAGSHPYAYDLKNLASAWQGYARLMAHWREHLPLKMYEVDYEELVTEPTNGARALVEFLDLPWDPACLEFHRNPRPVMTASQWQVRQPVYTSSSAHWRHYAQYLAPLREALGSNAESLK